MHAAFGSVRKLSIPRDSLAQIPGHDAQKINAAYALGGTALMVDTVESFLGNDIRVNHVVEVDFQDFPDLIDALGGVTVDNKTRICSPEFDNFYKGFNLGKGEQKLDGRKALGFARVRKNPCAPGENDLDRAARQQQVVSGMRGSLLSPVSFVRLPAISWRGAQGDQVRHARPRPAGAVHGPGDGQLGPDQRAQAVVPGLRARRSLVVSDEEKRASVKRLLKGR
ncbi:MAG: LCP family protein [Thermoleophilaceae bacterium]